MKAEVSSIAASVNTCRKEEIEIAKSKRAERNLIGERFGKLVVIDQAPTRIIGKNKRYYWKCICDCGNTCVRREDGLFSHNGTIHSCGCYRKPREKTNDGFDERMYNIWYLMLYRCNTSSFDFYEDYGGRGIRVCDSWADKESGYAAFREWALENGYNENLTIDRIDNDGDYCPENCRWVTMREQCNNRRSNIRIEYSGEVHNLKEWANILRMPYKTLWQRIHCGWEIADAFEKPVRRMKQRCA